MEISVLALASKATQYQLRRHSALPYKWPNKPYTEENQDTSTPWVNVTNRDQQETGLAKLNHPQAGVRKTSRVFRLWSLL